ENINVNAMVSEVLEFLSPQARKHNISLTENFSPRLPLLEGNRIELQQVLVNLILNAIDVLKQCTGGERRITATTVLRNSAIEISVSDTGPGIAPNKLA